MQRHVQTGEIDSGGALGLHAPGNTGIISADWGSGTTGAHRIDFGPDSTLIGQCGSADGSLEASWCANASLDED